MIRGKITKATGAWYDVKGEDGLLYACQLRGKFRLQNLKTTHPVVVGDEVSFEPLPGQPHGVIHEIAPRKNYLLRQSPHKKAYGQLMAANIDQVCLVVTALTAPEQLGLIDRFLVVAEAFAIPACIVFNKLDLLDVPHQAALAATRKLYNELGYTTIVVSAHTRAQLNELQQVLLGKVSLFSGPSGVGKSSLVNAIALQVKQKVAVSGGLFQRGKHTTTHAALFEIVPNTFIIDTPGIQLMHYAIEKQQVGHCFPEIRSRAAGCKFHNCTHQHEPNCAVVSAIEQGAIAASRYQSYQYLMQ